MHIIIMHEKEHNIHSSLYWSTNEKVVIKRGSLEKLDAKIRPDIAEASFVTFSVQVNGPFALVQAYARSEFVRRLLVSCSEAEKKKAHLGRERVTGGISKRRPETLDKISKRTHKKDRF